MLVMEQQSKEHLKGIRRREAQISERHWFLLLCHSVKNGVIRLAKFPASELEHLQCQNVSTNFRTPETAITVAHFFTVILAEQ